MGWCERSVREGETVKLAGLRLLWIPQRLAYNDFDTPVAQEGAARRLVRQAPRALMLTVRKVSGL